MFGTEYGMRTTPYKNRTHAGKLLAQQLASYAQRPDVVVLGLPRGGVPVAACVADALHAPLDVMLVRKLGVPGNEELAMGAIASGGEPITTPEVMQMFDIPRAVLDDAAMREAKEIARRETIYREGNARLPLKDRVVILVDDGLATGATMLAAVRAVRAESPARIVIAVPVGPSDTCTTLVPEADEMICLATPHPFLSVGQWYEDFAQTTDDEVIHLLRSAKTHTSAHKRRSA
jgi:putative phosphoribosyl transferase